MRLKMNSSKILNNISIAKATIVIIGMSSAPLHASSIEDAIRTALNTNPDIGRVIENRRAINYQLKQAEGGYLPTVDINMSAGWGSLSDPASRAQEASKKKDSKWRSMPRYESGITLRQMIFDGFATKNNVERNESQVISASRRIRQASEQITLNVVETYLEVLRQQDLADLAVYNVNKHRSHVELTQRKVEGGVATIADIQQAQSRMASAQSIMLDTQAKLLDAKTTYMRIVGVEPEDLIKPKSPRWALPKTLETALNNATINNPHVYVTKSDINTAISEHNATKAAFMPNVSLKLQGLANNNVAGVRGNDLDLSATVEMRYNLFNGNRDSNSRIEFAHRIAEARQRHKSALRLAKEETNIAWNSMESTDRRIEVQSNEVEANKRVRDTYGQQFDLGSRSLLELLDAENELFLSTGNLTTTKYLNIFSVYRILSANGVLMSTFDIDNIDEATTNLDHAIFLRTDMKLYQEPIEGINDINLESEEVNDDEFAPNTLLNPNPPS